MLKIRFRDFSELKAAMKTPHLDDPKIYAWKPLIIQVNAY